jgi:hypothetical protein
VVVDPATGRQTHHLDTGHLGGVGQVVVAPDGTWLATTGYGDEDQPRNSGDTARSASSWSVKTGWSSMPKPGC